MSPFDYAMVNASANSQAVMGPELIALVGTVVLLCVILIAGVYILYSVESFMKAHRFVKNFFKYVFYAVKYVFIGGEEVAAVYCLYQALKILAAERAVQEFDPMFAVLVTGALVVCFALGYGTERVIKRYREIRSRIFEKTQGEARPAEGS